MVEYKCKKCGQELNNAHPQVTMSHPTRDIRSFGFESNEFPLCWNHYKELKKILKRFTNSADKK